MSFNGQKVENTLFVQNNVAWEAVDLEELCNQVIIWWTENYGPQVSDLVSLREVVATDLTAETGAQIAVDGGGVIGGQIGGALPGSCSLAVSFRTALRGRSFRGRNYVVGVPIEQMADTAAVQSTWAAAWIAAYEEFQTTISTGGWEWVIASRFEGVDPDTGKPIPREAGVMTPVVTITVVDFVIDSQRRRLPGRGT